jgi:hypothetical protein
MMIVDIHATLAVANPDEVKNEVWQTKFRPVETTQLIVAESESHSESSVSAEVSHQSIAAGATYSEQSGSVGD